MRLFPAAMNLCYQDSHNGRSNLAYSFLLHSAARHHATRPKQTGRGGTKDSTAETAAANRMKLRITKGGVPFS
jgi:hypothetical protein